MDRRARLGKVAAHVAEVVEGVAHAHEHVVVLGDAREQPAVVGREERPLGAARHDDEVAAVGRREALDEHGLELAAQALLVAGAEGPGGRVAHHHDEERGLRLEAQQREASGGRLGRGLLVLEQAAQEVGLHLGAARGEDLPLLQLLPDDVAQKREVLDVTLGEGPLVGHHHDARQADAVHHDVLRHRGEGEVGVVAHHGPAGAGEQLVDAVVLDEGHAVLEDVAEGHLLAHHARVGGVVIGRRGHAAARDVVVARVHDHDGVAEGVGRLVDEVPDAPVGEERREDAVSSRLRGRVALLHSRLLSAVRC